MTTQIIIDRTKEQYQSTVMYDLGRKMRNKIHDQIFFYITNIIQPVDEDIVGWHELLDYDWDDNKHGKNVGGWRYKRANNPDAESLTDEQFDTLCRMVTVEDTLMDIYPE